MRVRLGHVASASALAAAVDWLTLCFLDQRWDSVPSWCGQWLIFFAFVPAVIVFALMFTGILLSEQLPLIRTNIWATIAAGAVVGGIADWAGLLDVWWTPQVWRTNEDLYGPWFGASLGILAFATAAALRRPGRGYSGGAAGDAGLFSRQAALRLLTVSAAAAVIAGTIFGIQMTVEDEAWPARGGIEALLGSCMLFSAYCLPLALLTGLVLSATVQPLMLRFGSRQPVHFALVGLTAGLIVNWSALRAICAPTISVPDLAGGAAGGIVAGILWWLTGKRCEEKVRAHG